MGDAPGNVEEIWSENQRLNQHGGAREEDSEGRNAA